MNRLKKTIAAILCLVMMLGLVSCGQNDPVSASGEKLAATINGQEITVPQLEEEINTIYANYGISTSTLDSSFGVEKANEFRDNVLEDLLNAKVIEIKMEEAGLNTVSQEDEATIQEQVESYKEQLRESIRTKYDENEADLETKVEADLKELLEGYQQTDETIYAYYKEQLVNGKLKKQTVASVTVSQDDISACYDAQMAEQKTSAQDDYSNACYDYYYNFYYGVMSGYAPTVYIPENIRFCKSILIQIPTDKQTEITNLKTNGDTEGADKLYEEELAKIKDKAEMVLGLVKQGQDFDQLIQTYSDDTAAKTGKFFEFGSMAYENCNLVDSFEKAALALQNIGDTTSELVSSTYGYHIIQYTGNVASGEVPLAEVQEEIEQYALTQKQNEFWQEQLSQWLSEMEVKRYPKNYRSKVYI